MPEWTANLTTASVVFTASAAAAAIVVIPCDVCDGISLPHYHHNHIDLKQKCNGTCI